MEGAPYDESNSPAYNEMQAKSAYPGQLKAFTVRERINQQIKEIEHRKSELLKFLELLDKNPDTEQILNLSRNMGI